MEFRGARNPWSRNQRELELDQPHIVFLVAEADQTIAGLIDAHIADENVHVNDVLVDPAFRCNGIAEAMLSEVLRRARLRGCNVATLDVRCNNPPAHALYKKFGFSPVVVKRNFYTNPIDDAVYMQLIL